MKKKIVALLMATTMTAGLMAGCGEKKAEESASPAPAGTTTT